MELLDNMWNVMGNAWATMGQPMFSVNKGVTAGAAVISNAKNKFSFSQAQVATAMKAGLIFASVSCVACGLGLVAKAASQAWVVRKERKAYISPSLIPQSEGEKEAIAGPVSVFNRVKAIFGCKVAPLAAGMASVVGGVFLAAHLNHFIPMMKR